MEVVYYSNNACSVCHHLKPKLRNAVEAGFPEVIFTEIDVTASPELAAQSSVFTVPVVQLLVDGREHRRFVRTFGVLEVIEQLQRIVDLRQL
jgi:thioredoxin-like negative regulator of GroEL